VAPVSILRPGIAHLQSAGSVPHPFAFFLTKGWETSKAPRTNPCGQRHSYWLRVFGRVILYQFRAPSFRLYSGERVGSHKSRRTNSCGKRHSYRLRGLWPRHSVSIPCPILSPFFRRKGGKPQKPQERIHAVSDIAGCPRSRFRDRGSLHTSHFTLTLNSPASTKAYKLPICFEASMAHRETNEPRTGTILQRKQCKSPLTRSF